MRRDGAASPSVTQKGHPMDIDTENNPAPETEAQELSPKPETEATEQSDEASQEETETSETEDQAEAAEEFEEVERNGKKFRIPKELAPELLMQSDYTRKAQEVAEQRREIEAAREAYEQEVQFREATWQETAALVNIEQRLAQFQNMDWRRYVAERPQEAQAAQAEYMQLQNEYGRLQNTVQAKRAHISSQFEQQAAISLTKEVESLRKPNPALGWDGKFDQQRSADLTQFISRHFGIPPEEQAKAARKAGWVQMANAAKIGIETLAKSKQTAKPAIPQSKPVQTVAAGKTSTAIVNPDKLSPAEWVKWREKQIAKREANK
jgi:hypothetical protein